LTVSKDLFPNFHAMDENIAGGLEAEFHFAAANLQDRDFEHAFDTVGASDNDGFLIFPCQDQHDRTSVSITSALSNPARASWSDAPDERVHLHPCVRTPFSPREKGWTDGQKKADVVEHPEVLRHVGLLFDKPPGTAELPFT